jgi:hypothetical protein
MIEIKGFDMYRDGGTIKITTNEGIFCFDGRLGSTTKGRLYYGYPMDDDMRQIAGALGKLIENSEELEYKIIKSLKSYKNDFYQTPIDHLVKSKAHLLRDDIIEDILN